MMFQIKASSTGAELFIYGVIGVDVTAIDLVWQLKPFADAKELTINITSPGGDLFEAVAMYSVLDRHAAHITVNIDGQALSCASLLAMVGDEIRMTQNGLLMIHEPWLRVTGTKDDMLSAAQSLERGSITLRDTYAARTKQDATKITQWMQDETWFNATEAKAAGFITSITPAKRIAACGDMSKFGYKKCPSPPAACSDEDNAVVESLNTWLEQLKTQAQHRG